MFDKGCLHPSNGIVRLEDCKEYAITKVGSVTLGTHNKGTHCTMMGVWYIQGFKKNIISKKSLKLQGCGLSLQGTESCKLLAKGR